MLRVQPHPDDPLIPVLAHHGFFVRSQEELAGNTALFVGDKNKVAAGNIGHGKDTGFILEYAEGHALKRLAVLVLL